MKARREATSGFGVGGCGRRAWPSAILIDVSFLSLRNCARALGGGGAQRSFAVKVRRQKLKNTAGNGRSQVGKVKGECGI